tara:strand:+ start:71 stop:325 length:255 start_codon:yes stop_codon:yes gene_type:complete
MKIFLTVFNGDKVGSVARYLGRVKIGSYRGGNGPLNPDRLEALILLLLTGCTSSYYSALEKFGIERRNILIDRIDDTQETHHVA